MLDIKELHLTTDMAGKVRNTNLPASNFLLPIFEAIINSIHSIQDAEIKDGEIRVSVFRESVLPNEEDKRYAAKITGFDILDNGIGFTDENLESFVKSDSRYKIDRGGKGLGRFIWLKAFDKVSVESIFKEGDKYFSRKFDFVPRNPGIENVSQTETQTTSNSTKVCLRGFHEKYSSKSCRMNTIANQIANHLFNEIMATNCPTIILSDDSQDETIVINDLVNKDFVVASEETNISIQNIDFKLKHVLCKERVGEKHHINYCADNRVVRTDILTLPNLEERLQINGENIVYSGFVSSQFLNENSNNERTGFHIQDDFELNNAADVTWAKIIPTITDTVSLYLAPHLKETEEQKNKIIEEYLNNEGAEYAPLKDHLDLDKIDIGTAKNHTNLDMFLYKKRQSLEKKAREEGRALLENVPSENQEDYNDRVEKLFDSYGKLNSSTLTKYVIGRRVILELFDKLLEKKEDNKYALEKAIHTLIYSMGKDSNTIEQEHNLWIIDERLPFSSYISSDKKFSQMDSRVATNGTMEPDLAVYHDLYLYGELQEKQSITFIEFKRPDRDDYTITENPIQQIFDQIDQVVEGKAKSDKGKRIDKDTRFYGYAICTITPSLEKVIKGKSELQTCPDGKGYFGYFRNYNLYLEVIDYDKLLDNAKKRNRSFFSKVGLPPL